MFLDQQQIINSENNFIRIVMRHIGSLYEFVQPPLNTLLGKNGPEAQQTGISLVYEPKPATRKSRIKTTLQDYKPSSKSHLTSLNPSHPSHPSHTRSSPSPKNQEPDSWRELLHKYKMFRYQEPINPNPITFPKKLQIVELQNKSRLNIDQGLLRALEKIRLAQDKEVVGTGEHEKSSSRYQGTLKKLKLVPMMNLQVMDNNPNPSHRKNQSPTKNSHSLKLKLSLNKSQKALSATKRIQFQRNLSWAKKHNKDGNFYRQQLGKIKIKEDWNKQVRKRKNLLSVLGQRYVQEHAGTEGGGHDHGNERRQGQGYGQGREREDRRHSVN